MCIAVCAPKQVSQVEIETFVTGEKSKAKPRKQPSRAKKTQVGESVNAKEATKARTKSKAKSVKTDNEMQEFLDSLLETTAPKVLPHYLCYHPPR